MDIDEEEFLGNEIHNLKLNKEGERNMAEGMLEKLCVMQGSLEEKTWSLGGKPWQILVRTALSSRAGSGSLMRSMTCRGRRTWPTGWSSI